MHRVNSKNVDERAGKRAKKKGRGIHEIEKKKFRRKMRMSEEISKERKKKDI